MSDDYTADRTTTGHLALGGGVRGNIDFAYDVDWFAITLNAGQRVQFDLEGVPGGQGTLADTYLRGIYASSGGAIANTANDDNGMTHDSRVVFTAPSKGEYYVSAAGYGANAGSYRLTATDIRADDFSANTATTGRISLGGQAGGAIEGAGDTDWFTIKLAAGQTVQFDLKGSDSAQGTLRDPLLAGIFNSKGALIAHTTNDDNGSNHDSRVTFTAATAGDYYVAASAYGGGRGSYRLSAATSSATDDFAASTATGGRLILDGHTSGTIGGVGDADWFKIALAAGQRVEFDLLGSESGVGTLADPLLQGVYDSTGVYIPGTTNDNNGVSHNARVVFTAPSAGNYYVSAAASGDGLGSYRIDATTLQADDFAAGTATTGRLNFATYSDGVIEVVGDTDWFKITLAADQPVHFHVKDQQWVSILGVYDGHGAYIPNTAGTDDVAFTPASSGDYYVSAGFDPALDYTGSYQLRAYADLAADTGTKGRVGLGGCAEGEIEAAGDIDWFWISLNAGQQLRVELDGYQNGHTLGEVELNGIYDASGALLPATSTIWGLISFTAHDTGDYYIAASSSPRNGMDTGTYRVSATSASDDFAAYTNTTGRLAVGGRCGGKIEMEGDADWFKITLGGGQQVQFDGAWDGTGTNNPLIKEVYDSSGHFIAGIGNGGSLVFSAPSSGDYYLSASASFSHLEMLGPYTMSAKAITAASAPLAESIGLQGIGAVAMDLQASAGGVPIAGLGDGLTAAPMLIGHEDAGADGVAPSIQLLGTADFTALFHAMNGVLFA